MDRQIEEREARRLAALLSYKVLDTSSERSYDDLTMIASHICQVPIALVSLVDKDRQWFKSKVGLDVSETPRDVAFCDHAIRGDDVFVVEDAWLDPRFRENPLVTGSPNVRFYAGAPLITDQGQSIGTLCVIDKVSRRMTDQQIAVLAALSRQVVALLELRRVSQALAEALDEVRTLRDFLPMCAWCKKVRDDAGFWSQVEGYLKAHEGIETSHGICPDCATSLRAKGKVDNA